MVDLDLTLCHLKRQGTSDAQDIHASEPATLKCVTLTTFALEGKENPKFPLSVLKISLHDSASLGFSMLDKHDESDDICRNLQSFFFLKSC